MFPLESLFNAQTTDPQAVDNIVLFFFSIGAAVVAALIIQSFQNESRIKRMDGPEDRSRLLSHERGARAQAYSSAIVLAGGAIGYYEFIYGQREKETEKFENAATVLYSQQSSPPARIRAMNQLIDWKKNKGGAEENQVAKIIVDGLRVWVKRTGVTTPCRNSRQFMAERIGDDTKHAIALLKAMTNRTVFLDFSDLSLQDADFSGAGKGQEVNLRFADFHGADLSGARLTFADLRGADFFCANLYGADLRDSLARAPEADLAAPPETARKPRETIFVQTRMEWAKLQGADLAGANLIEANMKQATVDGATRFEGADMRRAVLEKLTMEGRPGLKGANLEWACVDDGVWAVLQGPEVDARVTAYPLTATPAECQAPNFGKD
jgi:hypothetical protein